MTISQAFAQYDYEVLIFNNKKEKTRKNYRSSIKSFINHCGDIPIELITYEHFSRWNAERQSLGNATATISHDMSRIRAILRHMSRRGAKVIDWKEVELPKVKRKRPTWLSVEEIGQFLSVIESPRDRAIFACLFGSGARISELLDLNRNDIVDGSAYILGKGDKPGILDFDDNALLCLKEYMDERRDNLRPLFVSGQRRRITVSRVQQLAHQYADMAGIDKNVTPHVFRHSFATDLKFNGADIYDIMVQLRHSSIGTTQMYLHVGDEKKKADHKRFHSRVPLM